MRRFNIKQKLLDRSESSEPKGLSWLLIILLLMLLSVAVVYFSGQENDIQISSAISSRASVRAPRAYAVFYSGGVFSPTNLRIHSGDTVKFQNKGETSINIISDASPETSSLGFRSSGEVLIDSSFSYTFSKPGIFNYYNQKDPNESGTIIIRQ